MNTIQPTGRILRGLAVVVALAAVPAWADKPDRDGERGQGQQGQGRAKHERSAGQPGRQNIDAGAGNYFGHTHRDAVYGYYEPRVSSGRCPPGLAKKNNGCMPPGQAKQWGIGQPLPVGLVTYPVPLDLQRRLGPPPPGYKFIRVASDILMVAIGTNMVIDAIEDLGRMQ